jgi:TatD DNase family protein
MLIDTHCHIYFDAFDADRADVLARMAQDGVAGAVVIAIDEETAGQSRALANAHWQLRYSAGLHPSYIKGEGATVLEWLAAALEAQPRPVAIGECGLELKRPESPLEAQVQAFCAQLVLAREHRLPAVVHARNADAETCAAVESVPGVCCIFHCFEGGPRMLDLAIRDGHYVSFAGNLTYPKADALRRAAQAVPLKQLLVETDAPFLAPQAVRGQRCEPAFVAHTARALAELRGMPAVEMTSQLYANACRCFATQWA